MRMSYEILGLSRVYNRAAEKFGITSPKTSEVVSRPSRREALGGGSIGFSNDLSSINASETSRALSHRLAAQDAYAQLDEIAQWIGTPGGRGRVIPSQPTLDTIHEVRTFEADGSLATRRVRLLRRLGAGLAGTVYLAEDESGNTFVEKHFGDVPADGTKRLGRWLSDVLFSLFRQAPLSFREIPEAVVASHLINQFVVSLSQARYGYALTPSILYTRYDATTGGYVQAFEYVKGRPLRPCNGNLPLLGEGELLRETMRMWRNFLADDLGFWGLARQVDTANPNSFSNIWVTDDQHILLLDIVPGLPGFLEPRYIWLGLSRGQFPPFGDAIDFRRLERSLAAHSSGPDLHNSLELLRAAVRRWQDSEPRLCASPLRPFQVLFDQKIRQVQRRRLLVHLEVKGAISAMQAEDYRGFLETTGRFPKLLRHTLLKMSPRPIHCLLTDGRYALKFIGNLGSNLTKLSRHIGVCTIRLASMAWRLSSGTFSMLMSRDERLRRCHIEISRWIEQEQQLDRLSLAEADQLHEELKGAEVPDLAGLFILHMMIGALKQAILGPSVLWLGAAVAAGQVWLAAPALISPILRVAATVWIGLWRRPEIVFMSAIPTIGVLAAPLHLVRRQSKLGAFIIRCIAQRAALRIPGFGERGSLTELLAVAAAEVFLIRLGGILPVFLIAGFGLALLGQPVLAVLAVFAYGAITLLTVVEASRNTAAIDTWLYGMPNKERLIRS
jgi:hypothetical protein